MRHPRPHNTGITSKTGTMSLEEHKPSIEAENEGAWNRWMDRTKPARHGGVIAKSSA